MSKIQDLRSLEVSNLVLKPEDIVSTFLTADPQGDDRRIYLPEPNLGGEGLRLLIKNRSDYYNISLFSGLSTNPFRIISPLGHTEIACDGHTWFVLY
jgi:hypothetical protein